MSVHDREVISWPMAFALVTGVVVGIIALMAAVNWAAMNFGGLAAFVVITLAVPLIFTIWTAVQVWVLRQHVHYDRRDRITAVWVIAGGVCLASVIGWTVLWVFNDLTSGQSSILAFVGKVLAAIVMTISVIFNMLFRGSRD